MLETLMKTIFLKFWSKKGWKPDDIDPMAEIIFKMFYTKVSQMMTEIDIFKNIAPLSGNQWSTWNICITIIWRPLATEAQSCSVR